MTTTFVIAAVLVLMIFNDHNTLVVVKGDPDTSFHFKCCGSTSDASGQARTNALAVMDAAIALVSPGKGFHACDYGQDGPLAGYARCYPSSSSGEDCKLCLYNAQFRVVDVECPGVTEVGSNLRIVLWNTQPLGRASRICRVVLYPR
ncbi:unnamed protein product [Linum trigynum]|uniref:Gnk2-homologous domain-containing protein n=1 Tax=Linum trigynum TaxID=586398 RepID=A0AAV2E2H2_9ROSI